MVAFGAPFFSEIGEGLGLGCGVSVGVGVTLGVGVVVSLGVAVADGDSLGAGVGDPFFRFDFVAGVGLGDGVGDVFFRLGEALGDGVGVDFFVARLRCFRVGVGVGVASRSFLIFVPSDSSAASGTTIVPKRMAAIRKTRSIVLIAETRISPRVPEGRLCLTGSRPRDFREGNSHWVNGRDSQRGRGP